MTKSYEYLAKKLLSGEDITLSFARVNRWTEEDPWIIDNRIEVRLDQTEHYTDIVVDLTQEDDTSILDSFELYRMPLLTDVDVLKGVLKQIRKQACSYRLDG